MSIVLKLVVFPRRRANYGFIISRKQNSVNESCSMHKNVTYVILMINRTKGISTVVLRPYNAQKGYIKRVELHFKTFYDD